MKVTDSGQAGAMIEITPQMINAGEAFVRAYNFDFWEARTEAELCEFLVGVFSAITAASKHGNS